MEYTLPTYRTKLTERDWQKAVQGRGKNTVMYLPFNIFLFSDEKSDVQQGLIGSLLKLSEFFYYPGTCTVLDVPPGSTEVRVSEEVEDWNFLGEIKC